MKLLEIGHPPQPTEKWSDEKLIAHAARLLNGAASHVIPPDPRGYDFLQGLKNFNHVGLGGDLYPSQPGIVSALGTIALIKDKRAALKELERPIMAFTLSWLKMIIEYAEESENHDTRHGKELKDWMVASKKAGFSYPGFDIVMRKLREVATNHLKGWE